MCDGLTFFEVYCLTHCNLLGRTAPAEGKTTFVWSLHRMDLWGAGELELATIWLVCVATVGLLVVLLLFLNGL